MTNQMPSTPAVTKPTSPRAGTPKMVMPKGRVMISDEAMIRAAMINAKARRFEAFSNSRIKRSSPL